MNTNVNSNAFNDYDPCVIKSKVYLAKNRIEKLKHELNELEIDIHEKKATIDTLDELNQKYLGESCSIDEALLIVNELKSIHDSIICGEQERKELIEVNH